MLESVWKTIGEASGRRWVLASLMPAAFFWAAWGLVYYGLWIGGNRTLAWWDGLTDASRVLLLLATIIPIGLTALGLDMIGPALLRIAEGYWDFPLLGAWLCQKRSQYWRSHFEAQRQRWQELKQRENAESTSDVHLMPLTKNERDTLDRLEREFYEAPQKEIMPTRLGNILRAAEEDQFWRYGLDKIIVWPRLYPLLPEILRNELDDARASLDGAIRTTFLAMLFSLIWGIQAIVDRSWILAGVVALGIATAWLTGHSALRAAATHAELLRAAFDLHRFDLYRALHLPLPATTAEERAVGQHLNGFLWRGEGTTYDH